MLRTHFYPAAALLVVLVLSHPVAAAEGAIGLARFVDQALEVQNSRGASSPARGDNSIGDQKVRTWLASPPVLSATYLESDSPLGTDETEISLLFPFLSPAQRRIGSDLSDADPALAEASTGYRRWQLSGTLRELLAQHAIAARSLALAEEEELALDTLEVNSKSLAAAGSIAQFDLWLISQRLRDARVEVARLEARKDSANRAFFALTGTRIPVKAETETGPLPAKPRYHDHPEYLLINAMFEQQLAALNASSPGFTPWTVGVVGRELAIPELTETQLGLSISIPVDFGQWTPRSVRSSELALRKQFAIQIDAWRLQQHTRWADLWTQREAILAEQRALNSSGFTATLSQNLETVTEDREMPIENRVERRLLLLRAQARPDLLSAELAAIESKLRQLAGESL